MLSRQHHGSLFSFLGSPLSLGYVKVNFDGIAREVKGGAGYVVHDSDGKLLAIESSFFFEPSILEAKHRAA